MITVDLALAWARLPQDGSPLWWAHRLTVVRGFARYLHVLDEAHEVPATDVLPWKSHRANPYLYTHAEIAALITATMLRFPLRVATYQTLIGLLVVTGMRVGEAIASRRRRLRRRSRGAAGSAGKGGATRQLPLHPSTTAAVRTYLQRADRRQRPHDGAVDLPGGHQAALLQHPLDVSETVAAGPHRTPNVVVSATHPRSAAQLRRLQSARHLHP